MQGVHLLWQCQEHQVSVPSAKWALIEWCSPPPSTEMLLAEPAHTSLRNGTRLAELVAWVVTSEPHPGAADGMLAKVQAPPLVALEVALVPLHLDSAA